jgi:hypothetical protein
VTDLQKQMDDLKARLDRRETDLTQQIRRTAGDQRATQLSDAQKQIDTDKQVLEDARNAYDAIRVQYDDESGKHQDAQNAKSQAEELNQELTSRTNQLEIDIRDRDQKQAAVARSYDLKPFSDADITGTAVDPRRDYSLYSIAGLAILFALVALIASHRNSTELVPVNPHDSMHGDDEQAMPA